MASLTCRLLTPLAGALLLASGGGLQAADTAGNFAVVGPGVRSCAEFRGLVDSNARDTLLFVGWFQGYISRANLTQDGIYSVLPVVDANAAATLLYRVCANNPSASVERAADSLIGLLHPLAVTAQSEIVKITEGERTLEIWQATLVLLQQELKKLGHYKGEADGLFGKGTREAFAAFQKAKGLTQSGVPDIETLATFLKILGGEG